VPRESIGYLCDDDVIDTLLKVKNEMRFFERANALKTRISFYGIFTTGQKI
jgi:hypothetical protein